MNLRNSNNLGMAYDAIVEHYGDQRAKRSGRLLIEHIDEGLLVLEAINADFFTKCAFCLHPMFQEDEELSNTASLDLNHFERDTLIYVMEYRNIANAWLSDKVIKTNSGHVGTMRGPKLSPLLAVNQMLIADKVQNYKDFLIYHAGHHERSAELEYYFETWLEALGISKKKYFDLSQIIS